MHWWIPAAGSLHQVSCAHHAVEAVFRLHNNSITALAVGNQFCVTASQDGQMRVWPLDFSAHLLEVQHTAPLMALALSLDGGHAAAATADGALGILDAHGKQYKTLLRAHINSILALAVHPSRSGCLRVPSSSNLMCDMQRGGAELYSSGGAEICQRCCALAVGKAERIACCYFIALV